MLCRMAAAAAAAAVNLVSPVAVKHARTDDSDELPPAKRPRVGSVAEARKSTALPAGAATAPAAGSHQKALDHLHCVVLKHFVHLQNLVDQAQSGIAYVSNECMKAIKARDFSALKGLKITACPCAVQAAIDEVIQSLQTAEQWQSVVRHLVAITIENACFEGRERTIFETSEWAVWMPLLLRICASAVANDVDINKPADNYNQSTLVMGLARARMEAAWRKDGSTKSAARIRMYATVYHTVDWMTRGYKRGQEQAVDEVGAELPTREHGFCTFKGCGRRIVEYGSDEYGFCNNRQMPEQFWWITPASTKKLNPPYRCYEHATRKFMEIERRKFEALQQKRHASVGTAAAAAAPASQDSNAFRDRLLPFIFHGPAGFNECEAPLLHAMGNGSSSQVTVD